MAAILRKHRRNGARKGHMPLSYKVGNKGRMYRVCYTTSGRVLFVMLKHKHVEQALEQGKRRYREIVALASHLLQIELRP